MAYLLDTHAVLWALTNSPRLAAGAKAAITSGALILVSPVSAYELALKALLGRIAALPDSFSKLTRAAGFEELALTIAQADLAARLPLIHRDPWDRILAAQAIEHGCTLVSKDSHIAKLGVQTIW